MFPGKYLANTGLVLSISEWMEILYKYSWLYQCKHSLFSSRLKSSVPRSIQTILRQYKFLSENIFVLNQYMLKSMFSLPQEIPEAKQHSWAHLSMVKVLLNSIRFSQCLNFLKYFFWEHPFLYFFKVWVWVYPSSYP